MATAKNARPPQRPPGAVTGSVKDDPQLMSWAEIALAMGITRQRVELIAKRGMRKIEAALAERHGIDRSTLRDWLPD